MKGQYYLIIKKKTLIPSTAVLLGLSYIENKQFCACEETKFAYIY